ncbi:hypothetical protein SEUCBS140593_006796 [Sporothrix eucalyptigena]|uniref:NAD(P)-binding protein n=1 Tax=Sporothrix eucalyptigena TaxID=1812306 RepID=A0ABP0C837_9PEZI
MKVFLADQNVKLAEEAANELNTTAGSTVAWAVEIHAEDWDSQRVGFEAAVKQLGRIDYVLAVAGVYEQPWLPNRVNSATFEKPNLLTLDVNATGQLYTSALAIQQFRRQQPNQHGFRGKIVIVASGAGFYTIPAMPIYCTSKNVAVGFVRSQGKLLIDEQITLNAICPGIMRTAISTGDFHDQAEKKGLLVAPETLVEAFESLLGASKTFAEAVEVLPSGSFIKPRAAYTNDKSRESVEMTIERTLQAKAAALAKAAAAGKA